MRTAVLFLLPLGLLAAWLPARAETAAGYTFETGRSSNLFEDTAAIAGSRAQAEFFLRGALEREAHGFTYRLSHAEKRMGGYDFADEHRSTLSLGYVFKPSQALSLAVEAEASRIDGGDLFASVAGLDIGYRQRDVRLGAGGRLDAEMLAGVSSLTVKATREDKGTARFEEKAILPVRLEADVNAVEIALGHLRPAFGGKAGFGLAYRTSLISSADRLAFGRFPAETLRGALTYEREFAGRLSLGGEAGLVAVSARELGAGVDRLRPYLNARMEWQAHERLGFGASYRQDMEVADLDDALAEYIRTLSLVAKFRLTARASLALGYEKADSEWLYYLYSTRTRTLSGTLSYAVTEKLALDLRYRHLERRETDPDEDFTVSEISARIGGSF